MFTGIIRHLGSVESVRPLNGGQWLVVRAAGLFAASKPGDSIAVNGVCLTVRTNTADTAEFELGPETLRKTTFGERQAGEVVNLEWPMRVGDAFDGHFVQGHVEGVAIVRGLRKDGDTVWITITLPSELARLAVHKGSIAIDGVSLTVAEKHGDDISIMLLPYTVEHTGFQQMNIGQHMNVETDMIARHVAALVKQFT